MQFLITAYDGIDENALERRMAVRPRHLENIARVKQTGKVICAGGIVGVNGTPIGSFLVMDFPCRELFDAYLNSEPYVTEGVWQEIKIEECSTVILNDAFMEK